jgi:hypothetical protein
MEKKIIIAILGIFVLLEIIIIILLLNIAPMKLKQRIFTYQYGEKISTNIDDYVIVNSSIKENIKLNIDNVENKVGNYKAYVSYYDTVYSFEISIVDTIKPKATLKKAEWYTILNKKIYAKDLVENIIDESKTKVYFEGYEESVQYNKVGSYIERLFIEDEQGNKSATLRVKINVNEKDSQPVLEGIKDITIKKGDSLDLREGITATDLEDGDLTQNIVLSGTVNSTKSGKYTIIYSVKDSYGNKTEKERIITVQ